jgi:hypothetical protein
VGIGSAIPRRTEGIAERKRHTRQIIHVKKNTYRRFFFFFALKSLSFLNSILDTTMKNITRPIVIFTLFISFLSELKAQDPRFSQYYASPWNLNPAMTGLFNGSWRITGNYRDQWGSFLAPVPFRTYSAAFEQRIQVGLRNDYATFGIGAMHDEAGTARFMQNKAHLGGAFLKQLSGGPRRARPLPVGRSPDWNGETVLTGAGCGSADSSTTERNLRI